MLILNETQTKQLLAYLENSIVDKDLSEFQRHVLVEYSDNLMWDIADYFKIDLNEGFINPVTLRFEKLSEEI